MHTHGCLSFDIWSRYSKQPNDIFSSSLWTSQTKRQRWTSKHLFPQGVLVTKCNKHLYWSILEPCFVIISFARTAMAIGCLLSFLGFRRRGRGKGLCLRLLKASPRQLMARQVLHEIDTVRVWHPPQREQCNRRMSSIPDMRAST